jgi:hypothetical protein
MPMGALLRFEGWRVEESMALAFELVINYGQDRPASEDACAVVAAHPPLKAGRHVVPLHRPLLSDMRVDARRALRPAGAEPYFELSILPVGVGYGLSLDRDHPHLQLTVDELTELGHGLYRLLAQLTNYQVAMVGWDPEWFVDLAELREEWSEELQTGSLPGLVLSHEALRSLAAGAGFQPFAPGFDWIPYQGERRA